MKSDKVKEDLYNEVRQLCFEGAMLKGKSREAAIEFAKSMPEDICSALVVLKAKLGI